MGEPAAALGVRAALETPVSSAGAATANLVIASSARTRDVCMNFMLKG